MSKKMFPRNKYYINLDTGELLTFAEMIEQAKHDYDFDDWTNALEIFEYYDVTEINVY